MKKRTLLSFNTYEINEGIMSEFKKMQDSGCECVLVVNNTYGALDDDGSGVLQVKELFGMKVKCLLIYEQTLKDFGLYINIDIGYTLWHSTDYTAYIVRSYFRDFDFYWYIDYDCFLNGTYEEFLRFYEEEAADFIVSHLRKEKAGTKWCWTRNTKWAYENDEFWHGCLFGIARYSGKLLDALYKKRVEFSKIYPEVKEEKQWLNSEFFTSTEAFKQGFSLRNFAQDGHNIRIAPFDLNSQRLFLKPDNKMYHPIKGNLVASLRKHIENLKQAALRKEQEFKAQFSRFQAGNFSKDELERLNLEQNLINKKLKTKKLCKELGISHKESIMPKITIIESNSAKARIHGHLAYKLGAAMIRNSKSFLGYLKLPYILKAITVAHREELENSKFAAVKPAPLEIYSDYKEALKEKECFTYKLGLALMKADKTWFKGGYLNFYFNELPKLKAEFRAKKREKES